MDLPFFTLENDTGRLQVSSQFWKYLAISTPLTLATLVYWKVSMYYKKTQRGRQFAQASKEDV